ncbi:MAG: amidohydrolase family protein [Candidatus Aegiribacteria sp.]|nr:amidohydrolase family protein [Candidatus Aegiribacteria sp.]
MKSIVCGGVWTGPGDRILPASKISISGDRITGISNASDVNSRLFAIPGFVDAHCHFLWSGLERLFVDLRGTVSAMDLVDSVNSEIDSRRTGRILRGYGFDESTWNDPALPTLKELDRATGSRPVFIRRVCGHEALVNSAMLEMLPLKSPGVNYSTGVIREGIILDFESVFPIEADILGQACSLAVEQAYSKGVIAVYTFESRVTAEILLKNRPTIRISLCLFGKDADFLNEFPKEYEDAPPQISGLKFFLDGSLGASTAAVSGNYTDGTIALPLLSDEQVMRSLKLADSLDLMPVYHAIGGRALAQIDRVGQKFLEKRSGGDTIKIRIEHAEELTADWPGRWNPSVHSFVMQPNFVSRWQIPGGLYERKIGKERAMAMNPFSLVKDAGFQMGFGSDGMPFGPLKGLDGATDHPLEKFRIDTASALNAYTLEAASICGFQDIAEHLSPGRKADMTVLSADPFHTPWSEIEVAVTICDGKVVHGHEALLEEIS